MDVDMARKKRGEVKRIPIDLDMDDPEQKRLWEYWQKLSEKGEASRWARETLIAAVPKLATPVPPEYYGRSIVEDLNKAIEKADEIEQKTINVQAKPSGSKPATPKGNVTVPPGYARKPAKKIPPFVGRKTEDNADG